MIQVYNTLTRKKEPFTPKDEGKVSIYVCGVTPYDESHLGHALPSVIWDAIRRYLEYIGYEVRLIQNFTDIDDKVIARSQKENRPALEISRHYSEKYLQAMELLKVKPAHFYPRVSEHIDDIIAVVKELVAKGYAYEAGGSVYFDVHKFPEYGKLSGQRLEDLESGARIEVDEHKRHPTDFALWKAAKPGEPAWDSPWGKGRPGWHIECSVMSLKYLGNSFDFHGGGLDLVFPHHENEIAQSEAYTGQGPFARFWVHNGLLKTKNEKMSKSLGNFVTIEELVKEYPPEALRFFILSSHYRSPLEFSTEKLEEAQRGWERLNKGVSDLRQFIQSIRSKPGMEMSAEGKTMAAQVEEARKRFLAAMADDFNTALAIGVLFELLRQVNAYRQKLSGAEIASGDHDVLQQALTVFEELGEGILGLLAEDRQLDGGLVEELVQLLLEVRETARSNKDWATADTIRDRLAELGVMVEDTPNGPRWHQKR